MWVWGLETSETLLNSNYDEASGISCNGSLVQLTDTVTMARATKIACRTHAYWV